VASGNTNKASTWNEFVRDKPSADLRGRGLRDRTKRALGLLKGSLRPAFVLPLVTQTEGRDLALPNQPLWFSSSLASMHRLGGKRPCRNKELY